MNPHLWLRLAALSGLILTACDRPLSEHRGNISPAESVTEERAAVIGAAAAKALMESLGGQLKSAMESGGPVAAIKMCRQVALPLTSATGESFDGVTIRRITLKPRNPLNSPDPIDQRVLQLMATQSPPKVVIHREGAVIRYYQPLPVQEICLKCHGDVATFSKELVDVLAANYPGDRATGYAPGDLRGAIRVDVSAP